MCQSIVAGGVYFDEFAELSGWRAFAFSAGLIAAIAGAVGMGCVSFVAESHALISYTLLPGLSDCALHLVKYTGLFRCVVGIRPAWQPALDPSTRQRSLAGGSHALSLQRLESLTFVLTASRLWNGRRVAAGPDQNDGVRAAVCGAGPHHSRPNGDAAAGAPACRVTTHALRHVCAWPSSTDDSQHCGAGCSGSAPISSTTCATAIERAREVPNHLSETFESQQGSAPRHQAVCSGNRFIAPAGSQPSQWRRHGYRHGGGVATGSAWQHPWGGTPWQRRQPAVAVAGLLGR